MEDRRNAGTVRVADLNTGSDGSDPEALTRVGPQLYFTADDGIHGRELWRTDGTESGTIRVTDLGPGAGDGGIDGLTESSGRLFFYAQTTGQARVYRLDVDDTLVLLGAGFDDVHTMTAVGSRRVFFGADTAADGDELWVTDGSPLGAMLFADLEPGPASGSPSSIALSGGRLYVRQGTGLSQLQTDGISLVTAVAGATAQSTGQPCAASGFLPRLSATDPLFGSTVEVELRGGQTSLPVLLLLGQPSAPVDLGGPQRPDDGG